MCKIFMNSLASFSLQKVFSKLKFHLLSSVFDIFVLTLTVKELLKQMTFLNFVVINSNTPRL